MEVATRLAASLEGLAALAAFVRVETEGLDVDPRIRAVLRRIATALVGSQPTTAGPVGAQVLGMTRTLLSQAADLVAQPTRAGSWERADEALLQGAGRMSMAIAGVILGVAPQLDGLSAALASPGAAILDVGTGTGWLAIAFAEAFPAAHVVGLDIFEPALALARRNLATTPTKNRVEFRLQDAAELAEEGSYDAIWLAMPFLPRRAVPRVIAAAARALRPGGWLLPGVYGGGAEPIGQLLCDLRTLRSGGHPWTPEELVTELTAQGLTGAREVPRSWPAPVRLFAARAPS